VVGYLRREPLTSALASRNAYASRLPKLTTRSGT